MNIIKYIYTLFFISILPVAFGQNIIGTWKGTLNASGQEIPLVFHINQSNGKFSGKMDSPRQGAIGLPLSEVSFGKNQVTFKMASAGIVFQGELTKNIITGLFQQGGGNIPLRLTRSLDTVTVIKRPQEPEGPFPYKEENVTFENPVSKVTLAGTLTLPAKGRNFPAVVLVTGSGPQNRDSELFGHKPFKLIADYLTRRGFAVLRYDDRGVGASTGSFGTATTRDFANDALAAINFLRIRTDINIRKIGVIGHSEGGMIAPLLASEDKDIAFIAMLAGPAIAIDSLMILQNYAIGKAYGMSEDKLQQAKELNNRVYKVLKSNLSDEEVKKQLADVAANDKELSEFTSKWFRYFIRFDPVPVLKAVKCPIFAVYGGKDLQVPAEQNLNSVYKISEANRHKMDFIKMYPDLNHLFQHAHTGLINEYGELEETFSEDVLKDLFSWLKQVTK
ncbi:alpha/beta hydrolase family protein [Sphingobacterium spiritivorum]|uniref:alpha/beta hydrolase family protein n=1 Tax=Sphingobacterium spiritivorum TaxID=258 RepID=UPI00191B0217|nr:alpha/beta hydrolase [Sphingobacterium spiritivorum]QQT28049.1 alpha/beta hydrolase [Sphingobacterium spiritivorum]